MFGVAFLYTVRLLFLFIVGLLPVGGVGQMGCQGFLVREVCISVVVGGAGSLLSGVQ